MSENTFFRKNKTMLSLLVIVIAGVFLSLLIVSERLESYESTIRVQIADQTALLTTIAETTARNGADAVTESIVQDCELEQRMRFDGLLGQLDAGLARSELLELEQLFAACASIQAERKAVMVSRLNREIEVQTTYVAQLSALKGSDQADEYQLEEWDKLFEYEQVQSTSFKELVVAQKDIIAALLKGKTADSAAMVEILAGVKETQEALLLATTQADMLRAELSQL